MFVECLCIQNNYKKENNTYRYSYWNFPHMHDNKLSLFVFLSVYTFVYNTVSCLLCLRTCFLLCLKTFLCTFCCISGVHMYIGMHIQTCTHNQLHLCHIINITTVCETTFETWVDTLSGYNKNLHGHKWS